MVRGSVEEAELSKVGEASGKRAGKQIIVELNLDHRRQPSERFGNTSGERIIGEVEIHQRGKAAKVWRNAADEVTAGEPEHAKPCEVSEGGRNRRRSEVVVREIKLA